MLAECNPHKEYQQFVLTKLHVLANTCPDQIREYHKAISKMLILNLEPVISIITPLYPPCGRPAKMQVEIFRSFILIKDQGISPDNWVEKLTNNLVLRTIAEFTLDNMPKTSSYYDFINRVVTLDERPVT